MALQEQYFREHARALGREMEFKVYGHAGRPVLAFPSQDGRFFDFKNNGMIDCIAHLIEAGRVQVFCCDSIDRETWSAIDGDGRRRIEQHERWFRYITEELAVRILDINQAANGGGRAGGILATGCSMGGFHAANFFFRRPDLFDAVIALSGLYDAHYCFGDYYDDLVYLNSPVDYLAGMPADHPYIARYNACKIAICVGQGAWEHEMLPSNRRLAQIFFEKGIHGWVDFWGYDVAHDWCWWQKQLPYFMEKML